MWKVRIVFRCLQTWRVCSIGLLTGKPVGVKVVAGDEHSFDDLAAHIRDSGKKPDFISIDGAEGGTGATYQEMADVLGLPIYSGIHVLDQTLRKYGVRDEVKVIA